MAKIYNSLSLCIIIIVIAIVFLHYEMGYKFELFNVGGKKRIRNKNNRYNNHHHNNHHHYPYYGKRFRKAPWHYRFYHAIFPTEPHSMNITLKKDDLFNTYDLDNSGMIEKNEWSIALDGDLKNKMNDNNTYSFY